jgi:Cu-Zn family superoxide dismutase
MKRSTALAFPLAATLFLALSACAGDGAAPSRDSQLAAPAIGPTVGKKITAAIYDTSGSTIGDAVFTQGPKGVLIRISVQPGKLTPGWHGLHLHEKGDCADRRAGFKASGAHAGHVETVQHGLLNPLGPEAGDLPNLYVADRAPIGAEVFSPYVVLAADARGGMTPLLDADGSALILHASVDDHVSQPIGGAGDRVACAALSAMQ